MNTPEQFWQRVKIGEPDECWPWRGAVSRYGYPQPNYAGKSWRGNRLAWTLKNGEIPAGDMVCHTCDNRACCNPDHLYLGSARDNWRDGVTRGINPFKPAEQNLNGKMTDFQVEQMFGMRRRGKTQQQIAEHFGISSAHVANILAGRRRNVPNCKT